MSFEPLNRDVVQVIFSHLPLRRLFALSNVCKQFDAALTPEFFKSRCLAHFPAADKIPQFYDPFVKTVENPWKWICFVLSGTQANGELLPVSKKAAQAALPKLREYLGAHVERLQAKLGLAVEAYRAAHGGDEPIMDLWEETSQFRKKFIHWNREQSTLLSALEKEELYTPFSEAKKEVSDRYLASITARGEEPDPALLSQAEYRIPLYRSLVDHFRQIGADPRYEKLAAIPLDQALHKHERMARHNRSASILMLSKPIGFYQAILRDPVLLETYGTAIFQHILSLLPHLHNWMPHILDIFELKSAFDAEKANPGSGVQDLKRLINSFPEPFPWRVWQSLRAHCAEDSDDPQWGEDHFHEHFRTFNHVVTVQAQSVFPYFYHYYHDYHHKTREVAFDSGFAPFIFNVNPALEIDLLFDHMLGGFRSKPIRYPSIHPVMVGENALDSEPLPFGPIVVSIYSEAKILERIDQLHRMVLGSEADDHFLMELEELFEQVKTPVEKLKVLLKINSSNGYNPSKALHCLIETLPAGSPGVMELSKSTLLEHMHQVSNRHFEFNRHLLHKRWARAMVEKACEALILCLSK